MKKSTFTLLILNIICLISCSDEHLTQFNFNKFIKSKLDYNSKVDSFYKISICDELPFKWDKIIILKPYDNTDNLKKRNLKNDGELISKFSYVDEAMCILVFVENDKVVRYSYLPRNTLDFNGLSGDKRSDDEITKIQACKNLFVKRNKNNSFFIRQK